MDERSMDGGDLTAATGSSPPALDTHDKGNGKSGKNGASNRPNSSPKSMHKRRGQHPPQQPNSTIVMKNLDFNLQPADLEKVLRRLSSSQLSYKNFYLHKDAQGQFRGMAFINFHSVEDAKRAIDELMPLVLNGRKIYVEYRRFNRVELARKDYEARRGLHQKRFEPPPRTTFENTINNEPVLDENGKELDKRAAFFKRYTEERGESGFFTNGKHGIRSSLKSPEDVEFEKKYRELLTVYRDEENIEGEEIPNFKFEEHLDSNQRFLIHQLCDQLGLAHISRYVEDPDSRTERSEGESPSSPLASATPAKTRRMIVVSRDPAKRTVFKQESIQQRKAAKESAARKRKELTEKRKQSRAPLTEQEHNSIKWFKPRAQQASAGNDQPVNEIQKPSYRVYVPPRQPTGPDGSAGFKSRRAKRVSLEENEPAAEEGHVPKKVEVEHSDQHSDQEAEDGSGENPDNESGEKGQEKHKKSKKLNPFVRPFIPSWAMG